MTQLPSHPLELDLPDFTPAKSIDPINIKGKKNVENITFLNMPIASADEDKIGITQCASELQAVIKKGAQSIAVTSDFGGGKSSLIRCLESMYSGLTTKFCYVNLWSQISSGTSEDLHKSFIYQLASQINVKKGNYVSRRLSQNYGMLGITLPTIWSTVLSFALLLCLIAGFACTTFYDEISKYIEIVFFNTHHKKIGVAFFAAASVLALLFLYNTDIMFSAKASQSTRKIDEHELMDIYRSHICSFHLKHYIVVVEDLDRSEQKSVNKFIKELRRYYIPCKHKHSKFRVVNWLKDVIFRKINRITFIVNIKAENEIAAEEDQDLYSKAFDYVLNLKEINIDNYSVILDKLLEDAREYFKANAIPAFGDDDKFIPEFEWIIRGQKIGIREIKRRLNEAIGTYVNLCSNETLTSYMFEIINKSQAMHERLEALIIENNKPDDIREKYVKTIGLLEQSGRLSNNTLQNIHNLEICRGLPESICYKLKRGGFEKAFLVNAYGISISLIDFADPKTMSALQKINFVDPEDKMVSEEMLLSVRKHILATTTNSLKRQYNFLFKLPYPIITKSELQLIHSTMASLIFIDIKQIDETNCEYIAQYLCASQRNQNESYEILCFATSIEDPAIRKAFFFALDFDRIQYYRISEQRKKVILDNMSTALNFEDVADQLAFMAHTKCTNSIFEKQIRKAISDGSFAAHEADYAQYVGTAKKITYESINNLCALEKIYPMPDAVLEKLYAAKKYTYYVVSKTNAYKQFIIEDEKLEVLLPAYETIFLSREDAYPQSKSRMAENPELVSIMRDKMHYVGAPLHTRRLFANTLQTVHCLEDLFENYAEEFIIEYLSESGGFYDRDAAVRFIELLRQNPAVAASERVYENNYSRLLDSALKSNYTRYHHVAKQQEELKKPANGKK